jgi:hypothetical protein
VFTVCDDDSEGRFRVCHDERVAGTGVESPDGWPLYLNRYADMLSA